MQAPGALRHPHTILSKPEPDIGIGDGRFIDADLPDILGIAPAIVTVPGPVIVLWVVVRHFFAHHSE